MQSLQQAWRGFTRRTRLLIAFGAAAALLLIIVTAVSANSRDDKSYRKGYAIGSGEPYDYPGLTLDGMLQAGLTEPRGMCETLVDVFLTLDRPDRKGYDRQDMMDGCVDALSGSSGSSGSSGTGSGSSTSTGSFADLVDSVCQNGSYQSLDEDPVMCSGPLEGGGFRSQLFVYRYSSQADMRAHPKELNSGYSYAICTSGDGSVTAFVADVSGIGSNSTAADLAARSLQPLTEFGCTITQTTPGRASQTSQPRSQPVPLNPETIPTTYPTATIQLPSTDLMSPAERSVRSAQVGDCLQRFLGDAQADGSQAIVAVYATTCGDSLSMFRVVSVHTYRSGDTVPCTEYLRSGGQYPQVVLCLVPD